MSDGGPSHSSVARSERVQTKKRKKAPRKEPAMLHFSSVAVILGFLCLAGSMLVFAAVKRKPLAAYYSGVYPLATSSVPSDWLSRRARFLYKEASKLPQVLAAFGSRPLNSFQQSPELGDWWAPVWFPEGARMKNEYPPNAWWAVVPELERELRAQNGFLEVTHVPDDLQRVYKVHGIWFYAARGSGVFLETGRSLLAHNKLQALSFLGMSWREMARRFGRGSYM